MKANDTYRIAMIRHHSWRSIFFLMFLALYGTASCCVIQASPVPPFKAAQVGREVSVLTHLRDGRELSVPLAELLLQGKLLFNANWTEQEGGGRPLTKGTGR